MALHQLHDAFSTLVDISYFTPELANKIIDYVIRYELKGTNPLAFNTYMLGVHKCFFGNNDRDNFLSLFNITVSDIRTATAKVSSINSQLRVLSDPFNLWIPYVIHGILVSPALSKFPKQHEAAIKCIMLLQYKFFTSLVNHYFPYTPNENIMRAMFENMQYKFEIKVHGTWANVLKARAEQLLSDSSIHLKTLYDFNNDKNILYFISDLQTRVRSQMNTVTAAFYEAKQKNDTIMTYSSMGVDNEGVSSLIDASNPIESAISNIYSDCLNLNSFLDPKLMSIAISQFKNVNPVTFKSFIIAFSEYAVKMHKSGKSKEITVIEDYELYTGPEIFVTTLLRQCYRFCTNNRIDLNRPLLVLKAIKDAFSSSRISDEDILKLRKTMEHFVLKLQANRREIIMSGLRIGFVLYLILLSFKYTGVFGK